MKVVLINPCNYTNYPQPPMGLALIGAVLEKQGHQVDIIDASASVLGPQEISSHLGTPDLVGITAMTPSISEAISIARNVKNTHPDLPIILGGAHATLLPEETLRAAPPIDIVVRGEGERIVVNLLEALQSGKSLEAIPGITYRREGVAVSNAADSTLVELSPLPFLAYHLLPFSQYKPHPPHGRSMPFAALITSRGCPYKCSYCSKPVFGYKFRAQSADRVVEEITYYQKRFGIREIAFYDDVFTLNKKRAYEIADGILKKGIKVHWTCETRVDLISKELLQHMKVSGCYSISYGIESASEDILGVVNKNITLDQVAEAVHLTRNVGLHTIGYFMIGSPGETADTIRQTIQLAKKLRLDYAQFAIATPFPGTEFYKLFSQGRDREISWDRFTYGGTGKGVFPVFESDSLNRGDLQKWRKRAYREFYLRPAYIWQQMRKLTSFGDLKMISRGLMLLLGNIRGK